MREFMGYKDVVKVEPVMGRDGCADGFDITYLKWHTVRVAGVDREKSKEITERVWVREFDPSSIGNDGRLYGFGNRTVYKRVKTVKENKVKIHGIPRGFKVENGVVRISKEER